MAESRDDPTIHWIDPRRRGIIPLDRFHISRSLRRHILADAFHHPNRQRFRRRSARLRRPARDLDQRARSARSISACSRLGHAHALEVWEGDDLVGGVYGVTLGAAFFGESMFSRRTDASKIALAYLVDGIAGAASGCSTRSS